MFFQLVSMFSVLFYLSLCMCSHDVRVNARRQLRCPVFSFYLFIDSGDQSQVARLARQLLSPAEPYCWSLLCVLRWGLSVEPGATGLGDAGQQAGQSQGSTYCCLLDAATSSACYCALLCSSVRVIELRP